MIKKLLVSLVLLGIAVAVVTFVVLAVWDMPVEKKEIEKPVDTTKVLEKKS